MRQLSKILLVLFLMVDAWPALAQTEKPIVINPVIKASRPYGAGDYKYMLMNVYKASLWTDARVWSMSSTFALSLEYHMHFTAEELAQRSVEEMQNVATLSEDEVATYKAAFLKIFTDVNDGDTLTALYLPQKGIRFYHNATYAGSIRDTAFAQRFISIWFSERTSAPDLRRQLLAESADQNIDADKDPP